MERVSTNGSLGGSPMSLSDDWKPLTELAKDISQATKASKLTIAPNPEVCEGDLYFIGNISECNVYQRMIPANGNQALGKYNNSLDLASATGDSDYKRETMKAEEHMSENANDKSNRHSNEEMRADVVSVGNRAIEQDKQLASGNGTRQDVGAKEAGAIEVDENQDKGFGELQMQKFDGDGSDDIVGDGDCKSGESQDSAGEDNQDRKGGDSPDSYASQCSDVDYVKPKLPVKVPDRNAEPKKIPMKKAAKSPSFRKSNRRTSRPKRFSGYYVYMRERRAALLQIRDKPTTSISTQALPPKWKDMGPEAKQAFMDEAEAEKRKYIRLINQETANSDSEDKVDQLTIANIDPGQADGNEHQFKNQLEATTPPPNEINETQLADDNGEIGSPFYCRIENVSTMSSEAEPEKKKQALPGMKLLRRKRVKKPARQKRFSGYYVYMRERRLVLGEMYPEMSSTDVTRTLAKEWSGMDLETKQSYINIAAADKLEYEREMTDNSNAKGNEDDPPKKKIMKNLKAQPVVTTHDEECSSGVASDESDSEHVQVFTKAFLRHNDARESKLKALRQAVIIANERNATLKAIVDKRTADIEQVDIDMKQEKVIQETLKNNLNYLRSALVSRLSTIPLPGKDEPPTLETIDDYMKQLKTWKEKMETMPTTSTIAQFVEAATNAISKLEL